MRRLIAALLPPSPRHDDRRRRLGTGGNIGWLADEYRCVGIDVSGKAIDLARPRFPTSSFSKATSRDLGPLMQEARLVMLMDVLEHVEDDFALLSELLAAAAPALFLLTVPADMALWSEHDDRRTYRRYQQARLRRPGRDCPSRRCWFPTSTPDCCR